MTRPLAVAAVVLMLVAVGCTDDPGEPEPTSTESVTPAATDRPTDPNVETEPGTPSPTRGAADACAALEGGESLAFIYVTTPSVGDSFDDGTVEVAGCSNTFEASYSWELVDRDGVALDSGFGTATCGNGCVGTFSFTASYSVGDRIVGAIRVFELSARDGSEQLVNSIPIVLE